MLIFIGCKLERKGNEAEFPPNVVAALRGRGSHKGSGGLHT